MNLYGLRSLFDVVNFALDQYMRSWEAGADLWASADSINDPKDGTDSLKEVLEGLTKMREMCAHLGVDCTDLINLAMTQIETDRDHKVTMSQVRTIEHAIQKELRERLCFLMTKDESKLYRPMVNSRTSTKFPESIAQRQIAARCLALELPEAGVYHSMCALEGPLGAMARYFGLKMEMATWGTIINSIKDKLDSISRKAAKGKQKTLVLQFYGEAAKEFAYFNEAWRVHAMHGRASYDLNSARSVYDHVVHFTDLLAQKLSDRSKAKCRL